MEKRGLIIDKEWVDLILAKKKLWELRGSNTHIRGKIFLIEKGTKTIVGECELIDCKKLKQDDYENNAKLHCSKTPFKQVTYKNVYAWIIEPESIVRYKTPIPYQHPQGAQIWVRLK